LIAARLEINQVSDDTGMKFNFISVKNTKLFLHDYKTPGSTAGKDQ